MFNEFQFSFPAKDILNLIKDGSCERLIITGRVVYDASNKKSEFEIFAECTETTDGEQRAIAQSAGRVVGCPMPC